MFAVAFVLASFFALAMDTGPNAVDGPRATPPGTAKLPQPAHEQPPAPPQSGRDYDAPPPGSREDQALWRAAYDANNQIIVDRNVAARLQLKAKLGAYDERLDALGKQGPEAAKRAGGLKQRLLAAWNESVDLLTRQWPVDPTRACRYPLLYFESALYADESPTKAGELTDARHRLQQCLERAQLALRAVARSNQELDRVLSELERELVPAAPAALEGSPSTRPAASSGDSGGGRAK